MKKIAMALSLFLVGGAAIVPNQVAADSWCWDACRWDGCWEIGAEAIYWKPCTCDWEYGRIEFSQDPADGFSRPSISSDYRWGFRILGGYYSCDACSFLTLDWVYLRTTDTITKKRQILTNRFTLASGRFKLRNHYNRVNLRGGFYLYRGCDINFYTYGGIRWIDIEDKRKVNGVDALNQQGPVEIRQRSEFWGVGIEAGIGASYHIGCNFYLNGNIGGSTALGERRYKYVDSGGANPSSVVVKNPTRTDCVPGIDFRLGISYTYDCDCVSITGEIGYEHTTYFDALVFQRSGAFVVDFVTSDLSCYNWGIGGPFISLKLRF